MQEEYKRRKSCDRAITKLLKTYVDRGELMGAVAAVASKDAVLSLKTVGFADFAAGKQMRTNTLFWIASQSKPMTCAGLMMLVDEGRVHVDDPVEKYLPEFKGQMRVVEKDEHHMLLRPPAHPITVREILSHTAGLPFCSALESPTLDQLPLSVAVRSHAMTSLDFEPGTKYQYSNAGTNTAGRIIEVVSGLRYEDFMQQRLLEPLGMHDTTFWPDKKQLSRLAKTYMASEAGTGLEETHLTQLTPPFNDHTRQPMPAGGYFSTVTDVLRFCQMILTGGLFENRRYLSEEAVAAMTSKQTGEAVSEGYGYGWQIDSGAGSFGHGGAIGTVMTIFPARGLVTVLLIQHNGAVGDGKMREKFYETALKLSNGQG